MPSTPSLLVSTLTASLIAGPLLIVSFMGATFLLYPDETRWSPDMFGLVMIGLLLSVPVGFLLAGLPILFGGAVMSWIGYHAPVTRAPVLWAGAGAILAAVLAVAAEGPTLDDPTRNLNLPAACMIAGAVCATVYRRMITWSEDG
ncbi:MAG: hypothetical protein JWN66_2817 [Sphingomonas bacterium]|uniref:hypothetical protein n=1 Tax=Sphingomonas bacterium TaxID=1895847 RepID=UPI002638A012|nr:hypothetical protein [Sphingomonas bacterium]MDB5705701.1 hypothetical protein [Sphingomonas bacterium]